MNCAKQTYRTRAEADNALRKLIADSKRTGRIGTSWKRLNVYACSDHWHIGRANLYNSSYQNRKVPTPPPKQKMHSWAYIRRKVERLEKQLDHDRQKRIQAINAFMEAERQTEANLAAMRELEKQIVSDYFAGRI